MLRLLAFTLIALAPLLARGQFDAKKVEFVEPVRLQAYASGVALEWMAARETEVDHYAVWRHTALASGVVAVLEPSGRLDTVNSYRYIDQSEGVGDVFFEVRAVYLDGTYAATPQLDASRAAVSRLRVLSALDDSSLARLHLSFDNDQDRAVTLHIETLGGEDIETQHRNLTVGRNDVEVDYAQWSAGYYTVSLDGAATDLRWLVEVDPTVPSANTRLLPNKS